MGALSFRKRRAALVASVHEKDLISLLSENIHGDPRRAARTQNECDPRAPILCPFLLRSIFDHRFECITVGVFPAQPERLARDARPQQSVDRPLAVLSRTRKERGILIRRYWSSPKP